MLKLRVKQVTHKSKIKWQHRKAKVERKSARDVKNLHILLEHSAEDMVFKRECCWGYVSTRIHPKSYHIFPVKVFATLLSCSWKSAVGA